MVYTDEELMEACWNAESGERVDLTHDDEMRMKEIIAISETMGW